MTIVVPHYSELMIQLFNEYFMIPDKINVDIVINNKRLFTGRLRYIPDPKFKFELYKKASLTYLQLSSKNLTGNTHFVLY
ncbi:MAG: hypothetical protein ACPL3A_10685 [Thermoanaerobacteraceae bacterium]